MFQLQKAFEAGKLGPGLNIEAPPKLTNINNVVSLSLLYSFPSAVCLKESTPNYLLV